MALKVETGVGVPDANSYVTVDEIKAYATARGESLPAADPDIEKFAVEAFDYVESYRTRFQGKKTNADPDVQNAQFPRTGVVIDSWVVPEDRIPQTLKLAQCQATCDAYSSGPLMPAQVQGVKKEKIDVLEVEYAEATAAGGMSVQPSFPKVEAFLAPLLNQGGTAGRVKVTRG